MPVTCANAWYHGVMAPKAINYRMTDERAEELRVAAFVSRRSRQEIIEEAVTDWLASKGKAAIVAYRATQKGQR